MDEFESGLGRGLAQLADEAVDERDVSRVAERVAQSRSASAPKRRNALALVGAGIAAAAIGIAALSLTGVVGTPGGAGGRAATGARSPHDGLDGVRLKAKPGEPCFGASRLPLQALVNKSRVAIRMPAAAKVASPANLTGAWTCGGSTPFLTFADGSGLITVSFEAGWSGVDVDSKWKEMIASRGGGSVETILGQHALVLPPGEASPTGQVMVVVGDVLYRILGDGKVPASDLVAVAKSMTPKTELAKSGGS